MSINIVALFLLLFILSYSSILEYISLPNRYSNCLEDYLSESQCKSLNGQWKVINTTECENKNYSLEPKEIGICCNLECLSGFGRIKVEIENNKICKYSHNAESFYGFKNYSSFNDQFKIGVGYTSENQSYLTFRNISENKDYISSSFCAFSSKEDFLIGLSEIMNNTFNYSFGGGRKNGPSTGTKEINNGIVEYDDTNNIGFDCARLVMFLLDKVIDYNFTFGQSSDSLYNEAKDNNYTISSVNLSIGNALFYKKINDSKIHHTSLYLGNNKMIEAYGHNEKIMIKESRIEMENEDVYVADFIYEGNRKKNEENDLNISDGNTEEVTSSVQKEIEKVESNKSKIIEYHLIILFILILFIL